MDTLVQKNILHHKNSYSLLCSTYRCLTIAVYEQTLEPSNNQKILPISRSHNLSYDHLKTLAIQVVRKLHLIFQAIFEHIGQVKTRVTGDKVNPSDNCLYLMNHRTRLDWIYFWQPQLSMDALYNNRVIIKKEIKDLWPTGKVKSVGLLPPSHAAQCWSFPQFL